MNKIEEAQQILHDLGLPKQQQNKLSALTLLALAEIKEQDKWKMATKRSLTLSKDLIDFVNKNYNQHYQPNTRESFRNIALRPFIKHKIALLNPDDITLKPSSSKTHYALSELALNTITKFKTTKWKSAVKSFKTQQSLDNKLIIKNFKSIKEVELEISRVNVFVGKPNSGKSNLLESLSLFDPIKGKTELFDEPDIIRYNSLDNLFYDRNLSNDVEVNLNGNVALLTYYDLSDSFFQVINPSEFFLEKKKDSLAKGYSINDFLEKFELFPKQLDPKKFVSSFSAIDKRGKSLTNTSMGNKENPIKRYEFHDTIEYGDPFTRYLKPSGGNLFTIVQSDPKIREWINSFYEEYKLEFLLDFALKKFEIQKKENGVVYKIPFELTPDTFRRMLFHIAAIYSNKNSIILLEEPESHSFPPYIKELSELIKADTRNTYFITTHSPYFFESMIEDSRKIKDISFFHVYYEDYQTHVRKLTDKELANIWGNGADVFFNIDSLNK